MVLADTKSGFNYRHKALSLSHKSTKYLTMQKSVQGKQLTPRLLDKRIGVDHPVRVDWVEPKHRNVGGW
jgi:hypothetical protein